MLTNIFDFFYVDIRSLKVFRILLSSVLIFDLIDRLTDLEAHYSDLGVLPFFDLSTYETNPWMWSVFKLNHSIEFISFLFILLLCAALLLLLGIRVRLMTIICWIGIVSIQNRNPIIYQGGDDLLRMLLFWLIFIPNIDLKKSPAITKINSVATMALLCQVLLPFTFSAFFKGKLEWWREGSALFYAFSLDQLTRNFGIWISQHYYLTVLITRIIYVAEFIVFPLFLLPIFRIQIKILLFCFLILFGIGTMSTMMIGIFPFCFIASSVLFIPSFIWDKVWPLHTNQTNLLEENVNENVLGGILIGFIFTLVILWNVTTIPDTPIRFPEKLKSFMYALRLNQSWGMFSPTVFKDDGWIIYKAKLENNKLIDLNDKNYKLTYEKPSYVLDKYKNDRWRKFTEQIIQPSHSNYVSNLAKYILLDNKNKLEKLNYKVTQLEIIYMLEVSKPYGVQNKIERRLIFSTNKLDKK